MSTSNSIQCVSGIVSAAGEQRGREREQNQMSE